MMKYHGDRHFRNQFLLGKERKICSRLELHSGEWTEKQLVYLLTLASRGGAELMKSAWSFAARLAENVSDCRAIMKIVGHRASSDGAHAPWIQHNVHNDVWCLKKVRNCRYAVDVLG